MSLPQGKATHGKSKDAAPKRRPAGSEWAEQRLQRIDALLGVGVELNSALVIELIRSLSIRPVDRAALGVLFDRALEKIDADELVDARKAADRGNYSTAVTKLQSYLHRTLVDEVPIADRRLRRSPRFSRRADDSSAPGLLKR